MLSQTRGRIWAKYEPEMQAPVDDPPDVGRKGEFALGASVIDLREMDGDHTRAGASMRTKVIVRLSAFSAA